MLRENFAYLAQVGPTRQRLLHVAQRGRDVRQERRVLLHPIDEDEPPRVLELALHREQIEEGDELVGVQVRPSLSREGGEIPAQNLLDQGTLQLDIAVAQQRHQIVLPRPLQRVLEIDHHLLPARQHHQIATLVVAVGEAARRLGEHQGDAGELAPKRLQLVVGGQRAAGEQAVLDEVLELPVIEVVVEGAPPGEASLVGMARE